MLAAPMVSGAVPNSFERTTRTRLPADAYVHDLAQGLIVEAESGWLPGRLRSGRGIRGPRGLFAWGRPRGLWTRHHRGSPGPHPMFVACGRESKQGAEQNGSTEFEHAEMILLFHHSFGGMT